jgi:hypothetical protein
MLKAALGATAGATAITLGAAPAARAATGLGYVTVIDQLSNMALTYHWDGAWGPRSGEDPGDFDRWRRHAYESFIPRTTVQERGWANLSDVKQTSHNNHGRLALICASGGSRSAMAGIYEPHANNGHTSTADLIWSANVGGNPHAIELLGKSHVVVASSQDVNGTHGGGFLKLYAASSRAQLGTLQYVAKYPMEGAHGLCWMGYEGELWVIGKDLLRSYKLTGEGPSSRLVLDRSYRLYGYDPGNYDMGHDLTRDNGYEAYPDGTSPFLVMTATRGAYRAYRDDGVVRMSRLSSATKLKSAVAQGTDYGRQFVWVRAESREESDPWPHTGTRVNASKEMNGASVIESRGWNTARIYKARIAHI